MKREIIAIAILLILDGIWISAVMGKYYNTMIKKIQGSEMTVNKVCVVLAYSLMVAGLLLFVLPNTKDKKSLLRDSLIYGGLFGIILYGVYDFTAGAVFKDWDMKVAILDVAWGRICILYFSLPFWPNISKIRFGFFDSLRHDIELECTRRFNESIFVYLGFGLIFFDNPKSMIFKFPFHIRHDIIWFYIIM